MSCVSYSMAAKHDQSVPYVKCRFTFNQKWCTFESNCLVDSGSDYCLVYVDNLTDKVKSLMKPSLIRVCGVGTISQPVGQLYADVKLGSLCLKNILVLVMNYRIPTIIGTNVLRHQFIRQHTLSKESLTLETESGQVFRIPLQNGLYSDESSLCAVAPTLPDLPSKKKWISEELGVVLGEMDSSEKCEQMANLIMEYSCVFGNESNMGMFPDPVEIRTRGDPISQRQHPIAQAYRGKVQEHIDAMLRMGVIKRVADSQGWCTPLLIVGKKDGGGRVVANFKSTLNKRMVAPEPFNTPSVDDIFAELKPGNRFFSNLDLYKGYWQLKIRVIQIPKYMILPTSKEHQNVVC